MRDLPCIGGRIENHLAFAPLAKPSIERTGVQLEFCSTGGEGIHGNAQHQELWPKAHVNNAVKGTVWRKLKIVQNSQKEDGYRGEDQGEGQILTFFERRRLALHHHAVVHDAHVGDEQPRQEPFWVEDGTGKNDRSEHGQACARLELLLSTSEFGNRHEEDGDDDMKPCPAIGGLGREALLNPNPIAEEVRGAKGEQSDVDDPSTSDFRDEYHVWNDDHAEEPR